ncbi:MAG: GNAT family N-acetyltransferase [Candidatus Omnitrophica bacterium]|nr:GNAT family N-acetyltransferase [Candidatus Omnitrophota bacterium]
MNNDDYTIRTMTFPELAFAIDLAGDEGWNPGLHDAESFYAADPNGYFVGRLGDEAVASVSAVKYDDTFGFAGFYIVKPEHRGKRYGIQICNHALDYLKGCNIGCDGVVEQQENYKKIGFKLAYRNIRYEGKGGGESPKNANLVSVASLPFSKVESYDRRFFPALRTEFLKTWIDQPESQALGMVEGGHLSGYGVIRKCRSGYKIGPLFADNPDVAETLFLALKSFASEEDPVYLDTPEINPEAVALAERHNMTVVFETARMYTGDSPDIDLNGIFGVTTFELG